MCVDNFICGNVFILARLVFALMEKTVCKALVALFFLLSISACANSGDKKGESPADFFKNLFKRETPALTGIRMRPPDAEASRVEIAASGPFKYVSYRFHDPERLVIEMRNIDNTIIGDILLKEDEIVEKIEMVDFKRSRKVRAVIYMKEPFAYDLEMKGEVLKIAVMPDESEVIQAYRSKLESAKKKIAWLEMELKRYRDEEGQSNVSSGSGMKVVAPASIKKKRKKAVSTNKAFDTPDDLSAEMAAQSDLDSLKRNEQNKPYKAPVAVTVKTGHLEDQNELLGGVRNVVENWLEAWNKKDIKAYSSYYDVSFASKDRTRETWLAIKGAVFQKAGTISVVANKVDINLVGDLVEVTFIQNYTSKKFNDRGVKTLKLKKSGNEWKIVSEVWRAIQ